MYVDLGILYHQFASLKKLPNEPLKTFNTNFQRAYKRLHAPYQVAPNITIDSCLRAIDPWSAIFIKKSVPEDQRDTLAKFYVLAINMNQELNHTPGGIGYNLPIGVNQGKYGVPSPLPIGAPTMNTVPLYAPQSQASQKFATQALQWQNNANVNPVQTQYTNQIHGITYIC